MTSEEIEQRNNRLDLSSVFANALTIKGIAGNHHLRIIDDEVVMYTLTKDAERIDPRRVLDNTLETQSNVDVVSNDGSLMRNDWCVVEYDGVLFPGEVKSVKNEHYEVSVKIKSGSYWKWPNSEDKIFYTKDKIVKKLQAPILVNSREHYKFHDFL